MEQEHKTKLSAFFEREYNKLINYVRGYISDRAAMDAEDIVQEVALNMLSRSSYSVYPENLGSYVYRSLKNKVIDVYRKRELPIIRIDSTEDNNYINELAEAEAEAPIITKSTEMQKAAIQAIEELSPEQQMVIIATEFDGLSYDELSKESGIPIGTLLARKHRGLAKLQKILIEKNIDLEI
ncbi:MAG: RNA polymerase sigma factor [Saprospiraceae bacterium]|nr:RNA polymerase sigma factor [Saprospiraceae bacterium]